MKWRNPLVMAVLVVIPVAMLMAVPTVRLAQPPPGQYNIEQLWSATLTNPDRQTYTVWLEGKIVEASHGEVFWAQTDSFQLAPGTRVLHYRDVHVAHQRNAPGYEQFAARTGGLPEGDYTFTVWLMPDFGSSEVEFRVALPGAPRLISPPDGASLSEGQTNPVFTWTRPMPAPSEAVSYSIKMVEVIARQSKEQALQTNRAWFEQEGIQTTSLPYPTSAQRLEKGKTYAWQVAARTGDGREIGKSEIWELGVIVMAAPPGCNRPDTTFCPGNHFTNGNFESLVGNPHPSVDQDIDSAFAWSRIWRDDSIQFGDLYCETDSCTSITSYNPTNGISGKGHGGPPTYPNGHNAGAWAGCWIDNRNSGWGFREGMFNQLTVPIPRSTSPTWYTFTFDMAPFYSGDTLKPAEVGIFGIDDPGGARSTAAINKNFDPVNENLFLDGNNLPLVVPLVKIPVHRPMTNAMSTQTVSFNAATFPTNVTEITHLLITHSDDTMTGCWYCAFDNFCLQYGLPDTSDTSTDCCPGPNLVNNGNFEQGLTGFTSTYHKVDLSGCTHPYTDTVRPQLYSVVTSAEAQEICGQWIARDHSACNDGNGEKFMVVNGKTNGANAKRIWRQTVTTEKDSNYMFCAHFKNLAQCCFDIKPRVRVKFGTTVTIPWTTIDLGPGECEWTVLKKQFQATGTSLTISIDLSEHGNGDGNDLAIDDISLRKMHPTPDASVQIDIATSHIPGQPGQYNVTATQPEPPSPGGFSDSGSCRYGWAVVAEDANGNLLLNTLVINPPQWQTYPSCNFPGYNGTSTLSGTDPGVFAANTRYLIVYAVSCSCLTATRSYWEFKTGSGMAMMAAPTIRRVEEKALPAKSVARIKDALKQ